MNDKENWEYVTSDRYHYLRDRKKDESIRGLKQNVILSEDDEEDDDMDGEDEEEEEVRRPEVPAQMARETADAVQYGRPIEYQAWDTPTQMAWDRQSLLNKLLMDRVDFHARNQAWAFQEEINARHRDAEQVRHFHDWYAGRPYVEHPAAVH
jgi:hypothetical protein